MKGRRGRLQELAGSARTPFSAVETSDFAPVYSLARSSNPGHLVPVTPLVRSIFGYMDMSCSPAEAALVALACCNRLVRTLLRAPRPECTGSVRYQGAQSGLSAVPEQSDRASRNGRFRNDVPGRQSRGRCSE